jgi:hypothetical protein
MTKTLLIAVAVIVVGSAIWVLVPPAQNDGVCAPLFPEDRSVELINSLDGQTANFASTTVNITGRATEGGTQTTFTKDSDKQIVEQRFYGETGRSYMRFYFQTNKLFAIVKLNLLYAVPISVDSSGKTASSEERDYYLDANGRVCSAKVNGVSQPLDADVQEMIRDYITGIQ